MCDVSGDETAEFEAGVAEGLDPQLDEREDAGADRTTQLTSWWLFTRCDKCGHTFRRGDRVQVDPATRAVRHLDALLGCAGPEASARTDADVQGLADAHGLADVQDFLAGLASAWPVTDGLPVTRTDDEPYLVAPPLAGLGRMACLHCAHTFRPGEQVIVCPCQPAVRECRFAVHRDPGLGLVCWESWRPSGRMELCPVTLRRIGR